MSDVNVTGVSGGSVGEARTAGTMNIYNGPVNNIIIVQRQDENSDEFSARLQDLVSKLPGDTRLISHQEETTVILIGKAGSGKSCIGNTILGRSAFQPYSYGCRVNTHIQSASHGSLNVIETPPLFYSTFEIMPCIKRELVKSVVHLVIFVTKVGRHTKEDNLTVERYKHLFGVDCTRHMIVVFTCKDDLDAGEVTLDDYLHYKQHPLRQLLKDCGDRYMAVNNRAGSKDKERFKFCLMDHINKVKRQTGGSGLRIAQPELDDTKNHDVCNIM